MIRRLVVLAIAFSLVGIAAAQTKAPAPAKKTATTAGKTASKPAFDRALLAPAKLTEKAPEVFDVKVATTKGDVLIRVTRTWSPNGADRFYNLVKHGFYNGASFFRVVRDPRPFVVQFGISAHPEVSKAWAAANIQDDPVVKSNVRGFVTYAKSNQPNSRTTQIFINLGDNSRLDATGFSPFGEVVEGMDVVDKFFSGYGEGLTQRQGEIAAEGAAYLEKNFPDLDKIVTARIVTPAKTPAKKTP